MKRFTKLILILSIFIGVLPVLLVNPKEALAVLPGEGVTISPPIFELDVMPGNLYNKIIKINNPTKSVVEFYPVAMSFTTNRQDDGPNFSLPDPSEDKNGVTEWLKFSENKISLEPSHDVQFNYSIEIPVDAEPGGHYAAIFFTNEPPKNDLKSSEPHIAVTSMVGPLILLTVQGDIIKKGSIEEFSINRFNFKFPVTGSLNILNTGNVHFKPEGNVIIKNWFGEQVGDIKFNPKLSNVLPSSARRFDLKWESNNWRLFGKFTAQIYGQYGEENKLLNGYTTFWVIPIWLIISSAVTLLTIATVLVCTTVSRRRKAKAKNKL